MGKYGTSEEIVFASGGTPVKLLEETEELCKVCEFASTGGVNYWIVKEGTTVDLMCPNCGDVKHCSQSEVKRKAKT